MRRIPLLFLSLTMIAVTPSHAGNHEGEDVVDDIFAAAGENLTAEEKRNLEAVKGWTDAWEKDVGHMVDEFYADAPEVFTPIQNQYWAGRGLSKEAWRTAEVEERKLEERINPDSRIFKQNITHLLARGDTVVMEMDGGSVAIILRFDEAGKIYSDHSYYPGSAISEILKDPDLLTSGTRVPGGRPPALQAAFEKISEHNQ